MQNISEILGAIIVMLPVLIFIFVMLKIMARLRDQKVNLAELLSETEVEIKKNEAAANATTKKVDAADTETQPTKRSASRLILFLSGVTSLILGVCIVSYYFYMNIYCINCAGDMDLADLVDVMLALGIGVVPYAVNQVKRIRL